MSAPLLALVDRWSKEHLPPFDGRHVVPPSARAFVLAGMARLSDRPVLAIVPGERDAEELVDDLRLFTSAVLELPAWETLPFEHVSPNQSTMAQRSHARHVLATGPSGAVVVASVRAAVQVVSPSPVEPIRLQPRDTVEFGALVRRVASFGFERVDRVEGRGEFSVRGGIIDLYPAEGRTPVRIDFLGDDIESIRSFSVSSQRSDDPVEEVTIYPAREFRIDDEVVDTARRFLRSHSWAQATWDLFAERIPFAGMESWMPWLVASRSVLAEHGGPVVLFDPVRAWDRSRSLQAEEEDLAAALAPTWGTGAPVAGDHPPLYLDLEACLGARPALHAPPLPASPADHVIEVRGFDATPGDPASLIPAIAGLRQRDHQVVLAMDGEAAADRVVRVFGEEGFALERRAQVIARQSGVIADGIHHGFVLPVLGLAVLGEAEIAGRRRSHRRAVPSRAIETGEGFRDLATGDYIVHHRHGIGRFEGLVTQTVAGVERDYLIIAYSGEDKLYVPTDQLAAVQKYTGGETPRLSRMGGADWERTKTRVRKEVAAVAEQVVSLHRRRARASGHPFAPDTPWQREMEGTFPFEETPDQLTAIEAVKADMETEQPMDRLVFGDVGFGKTEVAVRAVFKAVMEGKQAAVLCPTTLLAQQHTQVFSDRFAGYPVRVEMLSRFLTQKEQRAVTDGMASGEVDVVIGTHRLLSDGVVFKDLGLLVVDEEQRFGVAAKDRIKRFRIGVDVLTLTATPIPRTLEMALTGVRDVSHIRTAPGDRHPILTYVGPYDERSVSAAIRRELLREGQVFYVHNRVQSIERAVAQLRDLVPDARYAVAHGQMSEGELEQVMLDFWAGSYDVLVATTIIESGLDLPSVNTLIVERAEMLGLGQLYQLRGRVGRGTQRAYAYLFHPEEQSLSEDAFRRLQAIGEATQLGSGFDLARRDLEIRGAGSMLGEVQSGHIAAVGFDLYLELVSEAVGELAGTGVEKVAPIEVRIDLPVDAHLPESYVADQAARLEAYRRLASTTTHESVDDVVAEWADRYGELPAEAEALIRMARLRVEAVRVGLKEIVKLRNEIRLGPVSLTDSQEVRLQRLTKRRAIVKRREGLVFIPAPLRNVDEALHDFLREMWPAPEM